MKQGPFVKEQLAKAHLTKAAHLLPRFCPGDPFVKGHLILVVNFITKIWSGQFQIEKHPVFGYDFFGEAGAFHTTGNRMA